MCKIVNNIEKNLPQIIAIFMGVYFALKIATEIFGVGGEPTPEELIADGWTPVEIAYDVRANGMREKYYVAETGDGFYVLRFADKGENFHFVSDYYSYFGVSGTPKELSFDEVRVTRRGDFVKLK